MKRLKKADLMETSQVKSGKINHSDIIKSVAELFALGRTNKNKGKVPIVTKIDFKN